jgi:Tol biopolymer transport system component
MRLGRHIASLSLLLLLTHTSRPAKADVMTCDATPDSINSVEAANRGSFFPYRDGFAGVDLTYRNIEFMWDSLFTGGMQNSVKRTLSNLAHSLVDSISHNPMKVSVSDYELIYNYFRRAGSTYSSSPTDTTSIIFGSIDTEGRSLTTDYKPSDRSHADLYILNKAARSVPYDGLYPSNFLDLREDVSSSRAVGDVRHANALSVCGPLQQSWYDSLGTHWTHPDSVFVQGFDHEFQHGLPPAQGTGFSTEMFSALSEAVGGIASGGRATVDVPYTWPLDSQQSSGFCGAPSPTCVRAWGTNYQARMPFAAYLAYNFRGSDTTATFSHLSDDLGWKWVRTTNRSLLDLQNLLTGSECGTCSTKVYFHPGGSSLDLRSRMGLLIHNWRVANYVNNSSLDEGQYGYPPQFGFVPSNQTGAWQDNDGVSSDDVIAIPPEVTLTSSNLTQPMMLKTSRSLNGTSYPLTIQAFGSEYWVIRSNSSLWHSGQTLLVEVSPEDIHNFTTAICGPVLVRKRDARLVASVVLYSPPSDSVATGRLWAHPEWAKRVLPAQWEDVDSLIGGFRFTVPSFGDSFKVATLVLSLADGPTLFYTNGLRDLDTYRELFHYRVELAVRTTAHLSANPTSVATQTTADEDYPTWSPDASTIAYQADSSSTHMIRKRSVSGGSATTIAFGLSPDWSPRGNQIAFIRDSSGSQSIWAFDTLISQSKRLTVTTGMKMSPVFSPNGRYIAYLRAVDDCPTDVYSPTELAAITSVSCPPCGWELRRIDWNGTNDTLLTRWCTFGQPAGHDLRWSPDGRWLYLIKNYLLPNGFSGPQQFLAVSTSTGAVVVRPGLADDAGSFDFHPGVGAIVLEQSGSVPESLVCSGSSPDTTVTPQEFRRIALRDTSASDTRQKFYKTGVRFYRPRWSPDGTMIAYASGENGTQDVFVGEVGVNHAPTFSSLPDSFTVYAGTTFTLSLSATDPDGESVTYDMPSAFLPNGSSFSSPTFTWTTPSPAGAQYFIVARARDGSGGVVSKVIKLTVTIGDVASDIVGSTDVYVMWTAPGNNTDIGRATEYDLRYSTSEITEANFSSATRDNTMTGPKTPGSLEYHDVGSLTSCHDYWFAVRAKYPSGTWSPVSYVLYANTSCGGGGGGMSARQTGPVAAHSQLSPMSAEGGGLGGETTALALEVGVSNGAPAWSVKRLNAEETAALGGGDSISVFFQARDTSGAWVTRAAVPAGEGAASYAVRPKFRPGRTVFVGNYDVQQAWNSVRLGAPGSRSRLALTGTHHSLRGDVNSYVNGFGTDSLSIGDSDTLGLSYSPGTGEDSPTSAWVMLVGPPGSAVEVPGASSRLSGPGEMQLPTVFALRQNQPNPFSSRTTIRFDLPVQTSVRLELFDPQGRRVRTLVDGQFPAGFHSVEWDQRDENGRLLGAGVYLYRIRAGAFRAQKKMVLLP